MVMLQDVGQGHVRDTWVERHKSGEGCHTGVGQDKPSRIGED